MAALAGQKLSAAFFNSAVPLGEGQSIVNTTPGTTTSTSYTDTLSAGGVVSLAFVTPPSGIIQVGIFASVDSSIDAFAVISYRISGAAGTVASSDNWQAYARNTNEVTVSRFTYQSGLVAGAAGTITMQFKVVVASTGTFNQKQILWRPVGV